MAKQFPLLVTYGNNFPITGLGMRFDGAAKNPRVAVEDGAVATAFEDEFGKHGAKVQLKH